MTRVLYVQHTNPAGYPPLEHSSGILAAGGAEVTVIGASALGMQRLVWPDRRGVTVRVLASRERGMQQKLDYLRFSAAVVAQARQSRPDWVYASDVRAAPIALALRQLFGSKVIYHEHDEPSGAQQSLLMRGFMKARMRLARLAEEVVVPNAERATRLRQATGRTRPVRVIWNCPLSTDVGPRLAPNDGPLRLVYQGTITPARLPLQVVQAMARVPETELVVIGYETIGSRGHIDALRREARRHDVEDRVHILGTIPDRRDMLETSATCHVGLSLLPIATTEPNEANMVGASNKAFDYMARGLGLIVPDMPAWHDAFVRPGFARACNAEDVESLAAAIGGYASNRSDLAAAGARARAQIRTSWNYESQFAPLASLVLESG